MFTDESRFALEPDDKRIRISRKQGTCNDNTRPHRAHIVDDYLENEGFTRMAWPAYTPDLNPIESLWDALGHAVSSRLPPPSTLIELETALQEE
ncbi:transposable element Tcb1 transposase [Trichonephila clavipes]|nr:transposable element Tcb1 transposase [Trichonephila clavipes]